MFKRTLVRLLRSAVSTGIGAALSWYLATPKGLIVAPVFQAVGKYLRDTYPKSASWLPF